MNIYSQELTRDVELVTKEAEGITYHGVRVFLKSPEQLHHTLADDDRSAVTFWCSDDFPRESLEALFARMADLAFSIPVGQASQR
jgi:hypothetical protein